MLVSLAAFHSAAKPSPLVTASLFPWERAILTRVCAEVGSLLPSITEVERVGNSHGYFADFHPADAIWTPDRRGDLSQAEIAFEMNDARLVGALVSVLDRTPIGMKVCNDNSEFSVAVRSYRLLQNILNWR